MRSLCGTRKTLAADVVLCVEARDAVETAMCAALAAVPEKFLPPRSAAMKHRNGEPDSNLLTKERTVPSNNLKAQVARNSG